MLLRRSVVVFLLVSVGMALIVAWVTPLPIDSVPHAAILLIPLITASTVVASWRAAGAPWPSLKMSRRFRGR
jgi:hypothetical protein